MSHGTVPMRLAAIEHRSHHHAGPSGYTRLQEFWPGVVVFDATASTVPHRVRRAAVRLLRGRPAQYGVAALSKETQLLQHSFLSRPGHVHYFDGEQDLYLGARALQRTRWTTSASFHLPPSRLGETVARAALAKIDIAIALGSNQVELLEKLTGPGRVHVVPHAVDVDFFVPGASFGGGWFKASLCG